MKATFEDFKIIFNSYQTMFIEMNSIPTLYQESFFDNPIYNELHITLSKCIKIAFGTDIAEWLYWYQYDKRKGPAEVSIKNNVYMIDTTDEFLFMIEKEYFNE
jgi:hypothetical protein